MRLAHIRSIGLLALLLPLAACEEGGIGLGSDDDADDTARAAYSRAMIFVARDATAAALLDFTATDAGSVVRRTARGWAEGGSGWTPLFDLTWEGPALRRAWRLVPHGPIRLRVGLDDEIEAIVIRDGDIEIASLENGDFISEWTPFRTSQLILREATLELGGEPMRGWLMDANFGVTPQATAGESAEVAAPNGDGPVAGAQPAAELPQDDTTDSDTAQAVDSAAVEEVIPPTPAPATPRVRALRAVLFSEEGAALVLGDTDNGLAGWLWSADRELTLPIVTLTQMPGDTESWMIEAGGGSTLAGRIDGLDEAPVPFGPRMVRGVIQLGDEELELNGVMRPADAAD